MPDIFDEVSATAPASASAGAAAAPRDIFDQISEPPAPRRLPGALNAPTEEGRPSWQAAAIAEINSAPGLDAGGKRAVIDKWQSQAQGPIIPYEGVKAIAKPQGGIYPDYYDPRPNAGGTNPAVQAVNAFEKGYIVDKALPVIRRFSPSFGNDIEQGYAREYPFDPSSAINQVASAAGGLTSSLGIAGGTASPTGSTAYSTGIFAAEGALSAYDRARQEGAGLLPALAQGGVGGALNAVPLPLAQRTAQKLLPHLGESAALKYAALAPVVYGEQAALGLAGRGAENVIAANTYDPQRTLTQGMGDVFVQSIPAGLGFGAIATGHAQEAQSVGRIQKATGASDISLSQRPPGEAGVAAHYIAAAAGRKVVWFKSDSQVSGFPEGDKIYINVNRPQQALPAIMAHEAIGHVARDPAVAAELQRLRDENPQMHKAAEELYLRDLEAAGFAEKAEKLRRNPRALREEGTAKVIEDAIGSNPTLAGQIAERYPNLFNRLRRGVAELVDRIAGGNKNKQRLVREQLGIVEDVRANLEPAGQKLIDRQVQGEEAMLDRLEPQLQEAAQSDRTAAQQGEERQVQSQRDRELLRDQRIVEEENQLVEQRLAEERHRSMQEAQFRQEGAPVREAHQLEQELAQENQDAEDRLISVGAIPRSALEGQADQATRKQRGFTKAEIEQSLVDYHRQVGHEFGAEDERTLEEAASGNAFAFRDKLPEEMRVFLEGRPQLKRYLRVLKPGETGYTNAGGNDAFSELGDKYFEYLERLAGNRSLKRAIETAQSSDNPRMQFLAKLYEETPASHSLEGNTGEKDLAKRQVKRVKNTDLRQQVTLDADQLQENHHGEIHGLPFDVVRGDGGELIMRWAGEEFPLEAMDRLPVDRGTLRKEEPAGQFNEEDIPFSVRDEEKDLFGRPVPRAIRKDTGSQIPLFHEPNAPAPRAIASPQDAADARIRKKFAAGEKATAALFNQPPSAPTAPTPTRAPEAASAPREAANKLLGTTVRSRASRFNYVVKEALPREGGRFAYELENQWGGRITVEPEHFAQFPALQEKKSAPAPPQKRQQPAKQIEPPPNAEQRPKEEAAPQKVSQTANAGRPHEENVAAEDFNVDELSMEGLRKTIDKLGLDADRDSRASMLEALHEHEQARGEPLGQDEVKYSIAGENSIKHLPEEESKRARRNLSFATRLEARKIDSERIRLATGWFRNPYDGQWRYELDDSRMAMKPIELKPIDEKLEGPNLPTWMQGFTRTAMLFNGKLADVVDHPALFKAYPGLRELPVQVEEGMGGNASFQFDHDLRRQYPAQPEKFGRIIFNGTDRGVLLHEIQHAVQFAEGFAQGGSARGLQMEAMREVSQLNDQLKGLSEKMDAIRGNHQLEPAERNRLLEEHTKEYERLMNYKLGLGERLGDKWARAAYRNLAGEIEARDTEHRKDLTAEERANTPPFSHEKIPPEEAIVRFSVREQDDAGKELERIGRGQKPADPIVRVGRVPRQHVDLLERLGVKIREGTPHEVDPQTLTHILGGHKLRPADLRQIPRVLAEPSWIGASKAKGQTRLWFLKQNGKDMLAMTVYGSREGRLRLRTYYTEPAGKILADLKNKGVPLVAVGKPAVYGLPPDSPGTQPGLVGSKDTANTIGAQTPPVKPKAEEPKFSVAAGKATNKAPPAAAEEEKPKGVQALTQKARQIGRNLRDQLTIDPVPKLSRVSPELADKAVEHASARIAAPHMVDDLLARVFPDQYKEPEAMKKTVEVIVADNILGGYDTFNERAQHSRATAQHLEADIKDKIREYRDLEKNPPHYMNGKQLGTEKRRLTNLIKFGRKEMHQAKLDAIAAGDAAGAIENVHDLGFLEGVVRDAEKDPAITANIERWKQQVNPLLDELYNEVKRVDPNTPREGRGKVFGARINLVTKENAARWVKAMHDPDTPLPDMLPVNYPNKEVKRDRFDRPAAFTGDYETDPRTALTAVVGHRWNEATKLRFYEALERSGAAVEVRAGQQGPGFIQDQPTARMPLKVPQTNEKTGITHRVDKILYVRGDLHRELRDVLDLDQRAPRSKLAQALTGVQLAQIADTVTHGKNILSVVAAAQGAGSAWKDVVRKVPILGTIDAVRRIAGVTREVMADSPEIRQERAEMAKAGLIRPDYPETGLQKITHGQKILHAMDTGARMVMNRFFDNLVDRGLAKDTAENRRNYVNQVGQYNSRLMGWFMSKARGTGFSPFIVAGRNFNRQARRLMSGDPGVEASSPAAARQLRATNLAGTLMLFSLPMMLNSITTGAPGGRSGTPLGAWDTGGDDDNGKHRVVDLLQITGLRRGLRSTGTEALVEGLRQGKDLNTIAGTAIQEAGNAAMHPWMGPAPAFVAKTISGRQFDLRGQMEAQTIPEGGAKQYLENFRAALESQNPLVYSLLRPAFRASGLDQEPRDKSYLGEVAGTFLKSPAGAFGVKEVKPGRNAAEDLADRLAKIRFGGASMTPATAQKVSLRRQLVEELRKDKTAGEAAIEKAVDAGDLSEQEAAILHKKAGMSGFAWTIRSLTANDAARVYEAADEEQRQKIHDQVLGKITRSSELSHQEQDQLINQLGMKPPPDLKLHRELHTLSMKAKIYREAKEKIANPATRAKAIVDLRANRMSQQEEARLKKLERINSAIHKLEKKVELGQLPDAAAKAQIRQLLRAA